MNFRDAIQKAGQILDEERITPTVSYEVQTPLTLDFTPFRLLGERGTHPRQVGEKPEWFQFKSTNFDLLCALLDQVPEQERHGLFATIASTISDAGSYRHKEGPVL